MDHEQFRFERTSALSSVDLTLPAPLYNLSRTLLARAPCGSVFVPIRSLQYLAVIDPEEIIFVDSQYRRWVEIAWQSFQPGRRRGLDDPVAYTAVYYQSDGAEVMKRLQSAFPIALRDLAGKSAPHATADILAFPGRPA